MSIEFYLASLDLSPYIILWQEEYFLFKDTPLEVEQALYYLSLKARVYFGLSKTTAYFGGCLHRVGSMRYQEANIIGFSSQSSRSGWDTSKAVRLLHTQNEWWTPKNPHRKAWKSQQKRLL